MMNETDLTRVDLNLLVVFEAVFDAGRVGTAAKRLHVSSSAVSHGLSRLRTLFGDPLFLKTPKGVAPTARATELHPAIRDILSRVRSVVGSAPRFDPATSSRKFKLGAPDSTTTVFLPRLVAMLSRRAPGVDLSIRQLLPAPGLDEIDAKGLDLIVFPGDEVPGRFFSKVIYEEEFVIAARAGHPFLRAPTLKRYCAEQHLIVSTSGETRGYIDDVLAQRKLVRRVAVSVPGFVLALAALAETDLLAAIPAGLVAMHARRFGLESVPPPFRLRRWPVRAVASQAALTDEGIRWLMECVERAMSPASPPPRGKRATAGRR